MIHQAESHTAQKAIMANSYTNLLYHIVFSTKRRRALIVPELRDDLYAYLGGVVRGERGTLLEIGGMPDHVHIVARFRSEPSVAQMIKTLKSKTSKWANEQSRGPGHFAWQIGYGAFTVSASQLDKVLDYVRNQERHHRRKTFQDEYLALLKRHGIEFEERYLWD